MGAYLAKPVTEKVRQLKPPAPSPAGRACLLWMQYRGVLVS